MASTVGIFIVIFGILFIALGVYLLYCVVDLTMHKNSGKTRFNILSKLFKKKSKKLLAVIIAIMCMYFGYQTTLIGISIYEIGTVYSSLPIVLNQLLKHNDDCVCYAKCTGDSEDDKKTAYELIFGPDEYEKLIDCMYKTLKPAEKEEFDELGKSDDGAAKSAFIQEHINSAMVKEYKRLVDDGKMKKLKDGKDRKKMTTDQLESDLRALFSDVKTNGRNTRCEYCKELSQGLLKKKCNGLDHWKKGWEFKIDRKTDSDDGEWVEETGTLSAYMEIDGTGIYGYLWKPDTVTSSTNLIWCMPGWSTNANTVNNNAAFTSVKNGYIKPANAVFFVDYTIKNSSNNHYDGSEITQDSFNKAIEVLRTQYISGCGSELYYYGFSWGAYRFGGGNGGNMSTFANWSEAILGDGGNANGIEVGSLRKVLVTQATENNVAAYDAKFASMSSGYTMVNMRPATTNHMIANYYTASKNEEVFKKLSGQDLQGFPAPSYGLSWFTGGELKKHKKGGNFDFTATDEQLIALFKSLGFSERKSQGMTACYKACRDLGMTSKESLGLIACASCEGEPGLVQYGFPTSTALSKDTTGLLHKSDQRGNPLYIDSLALKDALMAVQDNKDNMGIGTAQWTNSRCRDYLNLMTTEFGSQAQYSQQELFDFDYKMYMYELGPGGKYSALPNNIKSHNGSTEAIVVYSMFYYEAGFGNYKGTDKIEDYSGVFRTYLDRRYTNAVAIEAAFDAAFSGQDDIDYSGDLTAACQAICASYLEGVPDGQKIYVGGTDSPKDPAQDLMNYPSRDIPYSGFDFTYDGKVTHVQPYHWKDGGKWYRCCNGLSSAILSIYLGKSRVNYISCGSVTDPAQCTIIFDSNDKSEDISMGELQAGDMISLGDGFGHTECVLKNDGQYVYIGNAGGDKGIKAGASQGYAAKYSVNSTVRTSRYSGYTRIRIGRWSK